jgi:hypothetical protein
MSSQSSAALDAECGSARLREVLKNHLTDQQAAEASGYSIRTIKRWRNEGLLGFTRLGKKPLIEPEDFQAMLRAAKRRPTRRGR